MPVQVLSVGTERLTLPPYVDQASTYFRKLAAVAGARGPSTSISMVPFSVSKTDDRVLRDCEGYCGNVNKARTITVVSTQIIVFSLLRTESLLYNLFITNNLTIHG